MPILSASGSRGPPIFVFKGTKLQLRPVLKDGCVTTQTPISYLPGGGGSMAVTRGENGGIDTKRFLDWGYTFVDYFEPLTANGRKVLLIYDGYQEYLSLSILELFERNNIIVYALPALTSGKTQRFDVVLFSVFKNRPQDAVSSCAAQRSGQVYDVFDLCPLIRNAYEQSFTISTVQASFYRSGIWPFVPKKLSSVPRPATVEAGAEIMSIDELYSGFQKKQKSLRNAVLGSDATITRSGFIDTSKGSVVNSARALELALYEHIADLKKFHEAATKDARKQAWQDRRASSRAKDARHYRNDRVRRCAALPGKGVE